jgi:glycosyltransferase involved in cell wall biosynthesis
MRVLFCTDTYPPQVNGVSVVTALSVAGLRSRGWECGVVAPRYAGAADTVFTEGTAGREDLLVSMPSMPMPGYRDLRLSAPAYLRVAAAVRRVKPDLVHSETEFIIGRLGQIAALRAGIPVVSSYHTDFARYTAAYGAPWLRHSVSSYLGRFHRRCWRTYTPSGPAREDLLRTGVSDVEVWGRGVDVETYNPRHRSAAWRQRLGLEGRTTFLYVGRIASEKRVDHLVAAYAMAQSQLPADSTRFIIAGAGPREAAVRAAAPPGTEFLGYLDRRTELPALYASADVFVFASLTETLGLVVLEAMASGLPVIATPAGGVADHLRDGMNGIAVPAEPVDAMAQAMVSLARERSRVDALGAGARRTAEGLTWDSELDRLDASYREVCARASSARPQPAAA